MRRLMGKVAKNQVIEQAMDELNQEAQADSQSTTGLFQVAEGQSLVKNQQNHDIQTLKPSSDGEQNLVKNQQDFDSLIHFRPGKTGSVREELKNREPALDSETGFFEEESSSAKGEKSPKARSLALFKVKKQDRKKSLKNAKDKPSRSKVVAKAGEESASPASLGKASDKPAHSDKKAVAKAEDKPSRSKAVAKAEEGSASPVNLGKARDESAQEGTKDFAVFSPKAYQAEKAQAVSSVFSKSKSFQGSFFQKSSAQKIPMRITLQQSENLRVAQERIVDLETEIERLRKENEELIATGDIFRERLDKMIVQNNNLKKTYSESREEFQEEKRTLMDTLSDQGREIEKMNVKNKELEKRLAGNIQQIRVRERELENRLELMKLDNQTLSREKDQYILDLKRNIDKMKMDMESQQNRYDEISRKLEEHRSQKRRVTRGLQMILHISRGNELSSTEEPSQEEVKEGGNE